MNTAVPLTQEMAERYGIVWIDPLVRPDLPDKGLAGVCEWRPGLAGANIGRTNLTIGHVFALPGDGTPQRSIKERHPQDEVFAVFGVIQLGLSKTMEPTDEDVDWVLVPRGVLVIRAGVIHVPPVSRSGQVAAMLVFQGTTNSTAATAAVIEHP